ncbi:hypothetical protein [Streptomyces daghestanicus]|uniref:PPM-type phosphatase domain-containing protein n=1 Tax=Streptomyces daghestanicus TaxID=66885 RepID=A0ABQ3Q7A0_9ACTN|nr:hypothetical protein [Streptomyces daghestanicus]GGU69558.1 hypothetical protein GCM10010259_69210 [Streptomyces daghestanicus]GHI33164.1 hypothetical protein Sdagh_48940 [Streptomyces daghestanicus]
MREDVDEDLAVTSYATAQRRGDRAFQCDATAVFAAPDGTRAYALLDGVGDTEVVRSWTRAAAFLLARAAAGHADAEAGLRAEYGHYAADPARTAGHGLPCAAAVVAVHVPGGDRNLITACLGEARSDEETEQIWGHPAIEHLRGPARPGWLLLASDGAYEPHEDTGHDFAGYLTGTPRTAAERLVDDAVRRAHELTEPYADNATALVARITC